MANMAIQKDAKKMPKRWREWPSNLRRHEPDLNADKHELKEHELTGTGVPKCQCRDYVMGPRIFGALGASCVWQGTLFGGFRPGFHGTFCRSR